MELQSPTIATLVGALAKAQANISHATKDAKNPHFKSSYSTLESVIDATKAALAAEGIVVWQPNTFDEQGRPLCVTQLSHASGEWIRSYTPIFNAKGDAQGFGSGLSYARRYALAAICNISQTDDDGNEASQPAGNQGNQNSQPAAKPATGKAADFVISFGKKYKGMTIQKAAQQFGLPEIQNYANWMTEEAAKSAKPLGEAGQQFVAALAQYSKEQADGPGPDDWQNESWNRL